MNSIDLLEVEVLELGELRRICLMLHSVRELIMTSLNLLQIVL